MKKPSILATAIALSASSLVIPAVSAGEAEIQEVLVSASLVPIAANKSANAITVIDSQQLRNRAALSVSDLLRDVSWASREPQWRARLSDSDSRSRCRG
jgi:vitamin B12 transporter